MPSPWPAEMKSSNSVKSVTVLPLGSVDGSVVAEAERLKAHTIAHRRRVSVVRAGHVDAFELGP